MHFQTSGQGSPRCCAAVVVGRVAAIAPPREAGREAALRAAGILPLDAYVEGHAAFTRCLPARSLDEPNGQFDASDVRPTGELRAAVRPEAAREPHGGSRGSAVRIRGYLRIEIHQPD